MVLFSKKVLRSILVVLFCSFIVTSVNPHLSTVMAATPNVDADGLFSHIAHSNTYSWQTFKYRSSYMAEKRIDGVYKIVDYHDWIAYKTPDDTIHPAYIGNGLPKIYDVSLKDVSTGYLLQSLSYSDFVNGNYYNYLLPTGSLVFAHKKSSVDQYAPYNKAVKSSVNTWFYLDDLEWAPHTFSDDVIYSDTY